MDSKAKRQIIIKRLLRIGLVVLVLWLVFALFLNFSIWRLNGGGISF